jgi:glyoxylase-like metal-dependent hydrolase (beta-lactamase superfamily II)
MQIKVIHTGNFKLDGGAMFGTVPKSIWNKINPADDNNLCNWAMRCLVLEDGNRRILIDNGVGDKQDEKFFSFLHLNGNHSLKNSLHQVGLDFQDITDVILTHLHFDHCGGSVYYDNFSEKYKLSFPNAKYWVVEDHWNHAMYPNVRERPSFLKENFTPIEELGHLNFIDVNTPISTNVKGFLSNGHTEKMFCPEINYNGKTIIFCADLMPSSGHIKPNYVLGYDIHPLNTMDERSKLIKRAIDEKLILFFEHDLNVECATLSPSERGFAIEYSGDLDSLL